MSPCGKVFIENKFDLHEKNIVQVKDIFIFMVDSHKRYFSKKENNTKKRKEEYMCKHMDILIDLYC